MKTTAIGIGIGFGLFFAAGYAFAVQPGDPRAAVEDELGRPEAYIGTEGREVFFYPRGEVVVVDGRVHAVELISEEEAFRREMARQAEAAEREAREREHRERLEAEGMEIRLRKLADPGFMKASAAERVAFWQQFKRTYPMVPLGEEYDAALRERELELAAQNAALEAESRIRAMEMRLARAEAEAAAAARTTYVSAAPAVYVAGYAPRVRRPIYVAPCGGSHRGRCGSICGNGPKVTPYVTSAGYGFQRFRGEASTCDRRSSGVSISVGYSDHSTRTRVSAHRGVPEAYASQRPIPIVSRPWGGTSCTTVNRPVSRADLTAAARFRF